MKTLTLAILALCAAFSTPLAAQQSAAQQARPDNERERQIRQQMEAEQQKRLAHARENCLANRGVDCDTPAGLQEWLILERTRAEAVMDRLYPPLQPPQPPQR
jgi:Ni/Co efflux regulator RcnB